MSSSFYFIYLDHFRRKFDFQTLCSSMKSIEDLEDPQKSPLMAFSSTQTMSKCIFSPPTISKQSQ
jgi:hypothetical protein